MELRDKLWEVIIVAAFVLFTVVLITVPKRHTTYPLCATITYIDEEADAFVAEDFNGNMWSFTGVEDWMVGDIMAMTMDDNGTDNIEDDTVRDIRYCGYVD